MSSRKRSLLAQHRRQKRLFLLTAVVILLALGVLGTYRTDRYHPAIGQFPVLDQMHRVGVDCHVRITVA